MSELKTQSTEFDIFLLKHASRYNNQIKFVIGRLSCQFVSPKSRKIWQDVQDMKTISHCVDNQDAVVRPAYIKNSESSFISQLVGDP